MQAVHIMQLPIAHITPQPNPLNRLSMAAPAGSPGGGTSHVTSHKSSLAQRCYAKHEAESPSQTIWCCLIDPALCWAWSPCKRRGLRLITDLHNFRLSSHASSHHTPILHLTSCQGERNWQMQPKRKLRAIFAWFVRLAMSALLPWRLPKKAPARA